MRFTEEYFAKHMQGITGSAIRDIFKLLARPGMISFAGGNPSMRALEPDVVRALACEAIDRYGANILSRIEGAYRILPFFGDDIRKQKK